MKRLFAVLAVLVIVVPLATSAFADSDFEANAGPEQWTMIGYSARELYWEPDNFDPRYAILGSVWEYAFWLWDPFGFPAPNHTVDIWLWRPPTVDYGDPLDWPLDFIPEPWTTWGGWYLEDGSSTLRRQTWPTYATTDDVGFYYAKFMLPRNAAETWFPCGFPCRWDCTWFDPITNAWNFHAPLDVAAVYKLPILDIPTSIFWPWAYTLYWPNPVPLGSSPWLWPSPDYPAFWAGDTVHPLAAIPSEQSLPDGNVTFLEWWDAIDPDAIPGSGDEFWVQNPNYVAHWEYLVEGYLWVTTDLEMNWPDDWPLLCPWQ
jgi:hypothetical protein